MLAPTRRDCGVADYARHLRASLGSRVDGTVVEVESIHGDYRRAGRRMNEADVAHVQYEHGFFLDGDRPAENFDAFVDAVRVPLLLTMHCEPLDHPLWRRRLADPELRFFAHGRTVVEALRGMGASGPIEWTHLPAGPRVRGGTSVAEVRRAHGLEGRTALGIFGFVKAHKGYDVALEALRRLPPRAVLVIAGAPQDARDVHTRAEIRERARGMGLSGRLVETGWVAEAEVGPLLEACDVVLAPFRSMTASASIATALSWERPVVASRLASNVDLEREFGCLRLVDPGSAADLASAIERVLADSSLREALREGARRYRRACGFDALAARTERAYDELRRR